MTQQSLMNPGTPEGLAPEPSILQQLLRLAIPSIVSSVSMTLMHFTNNWMISRLDSAVAPDQKVNLAAALNGGLSAWVFIFTAMGVGTAVNTLASQSLGRGDRHECAAFAWQGLWLALFSSALFIPVAFIGPVWFRWLGHDPHLIPVESRFFQLVTASAPIILATAVMNNFFLGIHRPINQMVAGIVGNIVDFAMCYCLLFGHCGFPRLGVAGAALSTACGSAASFLVMFSVLLWPGVARPYGAYDGWKPARRHLWQVLRLGIPAGLQQGSDMCSWSVFSVAIVGSFGTVYSAAQGTVMNFIFLSFMPAIGVGIAVNALVGRKIGERRFDLAHAAAFAGMKLTLAYMGSCGLIFFLFRHQLVAMFLDDPASISIAAGMLLMAAIFQLFDALNVVFISALRGAGDVRQPTLVMMALAWGVCAGGGALVAHLLPQWKAMGPWLMATIYIILVAGYVLWRWRSEAWKKLDIFAVHLQAK